MTPRPWSQSRKQAEEEHDETVMYLSWLVRGWLYRCLGRLEILWRGQRGFPCREAWRAASRGRRPRGLCRGFLLPAPSHRGDGAAHEKTNGDRPSHHSRARPGGPYPERRHRGRHFRHGEERLLADLGMVLQG